MTNEQALSGPSAQSVSLPIKVRLSRCLFLPPLVLSAIALFTASSENCDTAALVIIHSLGPILGISIEWLRRTQVAAFDTDAFSYGTKRIPYISINDVIIVHQPRPFIFRRFFIIFKWGKHEDTFVLHMYAFSKGDQKLILTMIHAIVDSSKISTYP